MRRSAQENAQVEEAVRRYQLLSPREQEALELTAKLANLLRQICDSGRGEGEAFDSANHDWNEAAGHIHNIQHMVMAQAAARAYPSKYRLLGGTLARANYDMVGDQMMPRGD